MIDVATDRDNIGQGVEIFVNIARMLFETLESQVFKVSTKFKGLKEKLTLQLLQDLDMLVGGYLLVFIYVLLMLGRLVLKKV